MIQTLLAKIGIGIIAGLSAITGLFSGGQTNLGAAIPQSVAVFETSLASPIGATDSSMSLASNATRGGGSLSGYTCLTVDEGLTNAEYICGTVSGTAVSALVRGVDPVSATSSITALKFSHRRGADVKITDWPILGVIQNKMTGVDGFDNLISYNSNPTFTASTSIISKGYADTILANATSTITSNFLNLTNSSQTVSGNNTYSGNNTLSGTNSFATGTFSGTLGVTGIATFTVPPVSATNPSNANQVANKAYVDAIVVAGGVTANNTVTGISRIASSTQISSGYSSTTAYAIPSSLASSTASTSPIVVVTNSSGVIDSSFIASSSLASSSLINSYGFGDGSDGNVTIASNSTTTLTRDMYYNNLTVSGVILTEGFQIFVNNTITGTGTIKWEIPNNGGNASGSTGGIASASTTVAGKFVNIGGSAGGNGGAGGGQNNGFNGSAGTASLLSIGVVGGAGSAGTGGNFASNGNGGTVGTISSSTPKIGTISYNTLTGTNFSSSTVFSNWKSSAGSTGGGGGCGSTLNGAGGGGGGGGASGGIVWIAARIFAGTFTIDVSGGNGGNGVAGSGNSGSGGGGAGGSGGATVVIYGTKTWAGTYNVSAGTSGTGGSPTTVNGISYEFPINSLTR